MFPSAVRPPRPSPPQASPSTPTHGHLALAVTALGLSQCCLLGSPSNKRVLVFESCLLHFVLCVCVCVVSWFTGEALKGKSYCVKGRYRMRSASLGLILPCPAHHFRSCSACLTSGGHSHEVRTTCWLAQCRLRSRVAPSSESCPGCSLRTLHQLRTPLSETFICSRGNLAGLAESLVPGWSPLGSNHQ